MEHEMWGQIPDILRGVEGIPQNGMADFLHVHPELMGSPGQGMQSYEAAAFVRLCVDHRILGDCLPPVGKIHNLVGAVRNISDKGQLDNPLGTFRNAVNPGVINFEGAPFLELLSQNA